MVTNMLKDVGMKRLWSKAIVDGETWCWVWNGAKNSDGYSQIKVAGKSVQAHRVAYEAAFGPIPPDMTLDHLCRNHACINPWHLEVVTNLENIRRGEAGLWFGRQQRDKTHCPRGHPYDERNTYIRPDGGRDCRACIRLRTANYRAKLKGGENACESSNFN